MPDATDQWEDIMDIALTTTNFENITEFDKEKNIYLSLLPVFGTILARDEGPVTIIPPQYTSESGAHTNFGHSKRI